MLLLNFLLFFFHMNCLSLICFYLYTRFPYNNIYPIISMSLLLFMDIIVSPRFETEMVDFRILSHVITTLHFLFHTVDMLSLVNFLYHTYRVYLDFEQTNLIHQQTTIDSQKYPILFPYHGERECYICLMEQTDKHRLFQLPCSHTFHKECLHTWIDHSHAECCPVCKATFRREIPSMVFSF